MLIDCNSIHKHLQFTTEKENNNTINYLDLTIHGKFTTLKYNIL
jgi:hypothetical protein